MTTLVKEKVLKPLLSCTVRKNNHFMFHCMEWESLFMLLYAFLIQTCFSLGHQAIINWPFTCRVKTPNSWLSKTPRSRYRMSYTDHWDTQGWGRVFHQSERHKLSLQWRDVSLPPVYSSLLSCELYPWHSLQSLPAKSRDMWAQELAKQGQLLYWAQFIKLQHYTGVSNIIKKLNFTTISTWEFFCTSRSLYFTDLHNLGWKGSPNLFKWAAKNYPDRNI